MITNANKKDVKQSLSECWSSVRDKVEFAENCKNHNPSPNPVRPVSPQYNLLKSQDLDLRLDLILHN